MPDISRRRKGEMLRALFAVLGEHPDGLSARSAIDATAQRLNLTEFEKGVYDSGAVPVRRFDKILRFTTIDAVKAGWLVKSNGEWAITQEGLAAYDRFREPDLLMAEASRLYRAWRKHKPATSADAVELGGVHDDEGVTAATVEEAQDDARAQISEYLGSMPPYDLQELVAALLRAMGYHVAWIAPPGPDRGIDIVAYTDPLGASGPRIKVQVKRRADKVPVAEVRSFMAVLSPGDVGIFVAIAGFTSDAHSEARNQENRRLSLFGLNELLELWTEHYPKVAVEHQALLPLQPVYYLAPR